MARAALREAEERRRAEEEGEEGVGYYRMCAMSGTTGAGSGSVAAGREECRRWLPVMNLYHWALPSLFLPTHSFRGEAPISSPRKSGHRSTTG